MNPRTILRPLLSQRLTPAEREALAAALRDLADEQERLAAAQRRDAARPAAQRITGAGGAKGGRPGAMHVYLEVRNERSREEPTYMLRIGRGVYDALQAFRRDPAAQLRLAVQLVGDRLLLTEDSGGYAVTVNQGGVRVNVSGSRDSLAHLPAGVRWPAEAHQGRIVVTIKD